VKDIPAFFVAVRLDKKIDVADRKTFPDKELLKKYGYYLGEKRSSLLKALEPMWVAFKPFSNIMI